MAKKKLAAVGGARILLDLPIHRLFLDPANPRLPEEMQGRKEQEILQYLYKNFDLDELASSLSQNGYFDEEPLVGVPVNLPKEFAKQSARALKGDLEYKKFLEDDKTQLIVVEGNRRLAAIRILLEGAQQNQLNVQRWPTLSKEVVEDLKVLPVIIYPRREEVLPYLGVRHITSIKKWEPFAKARYVADLIESGMSIEDIEKQIGDRTGSARKSFICYRLVKQAENIGLDTEKAKEAFSYLLLAINQSAIRQFLGLSADLTLTKRKLIPEEKVKNLRYVFHWLFGEGKVLPIVAESRDITNKLTPVLRSKEATKQLLAGRDLETAFEYTEGEETMLINYLEKANRYIEMSLEIARRHKNSVVKERLERLSETLEQLKKQF